MQRPYVNCTDSDLCVRICMHRRRRHRSFEFAGSQFAGHTDVVGLAVAGAQHYSPQRSDEIVCGTRIHRFGVHDSVTIARHCGAVRCNVAQQLYAEEACRLHVDRCISRIHHTVRPVRDGRSGAGQCV